MDYNALIVELIEKFIVAIPQLVAVLTIVGVSLKNLKNTTKEFPDQLEETKTELKGAFDEASGIMMEGFNSLSAESKAMLEGVMNTLVTSVTSAMDSMKNELITYREEIQVIKSISNLLVKENKAMFDVIIDLVAQNPEMVKKGLSTVITNSLNMTQEELQKYTVLLVDNLPLLESVLKEAFVNFDMEDINSILEALGYERTKTENSDTV